MTVACCPWCGAEYGVAATKCWDCKLALDDPPAATLAETDPDAEVGFELDEWSAADRGGLASSLRSGGIDYRWEPGLVLVVRAGDEGQVDALLDDLEGDDEAGRGAGATRAMAAVVVRAGTTTTTTTTRTTTTRTTGTGASGPRRRWPTCSSPPTV